MKYTEEQFGRKIRMLIVAVPVCITAWLFVRYFSFSGTYTVSYDFSNDSAIVSEFTPHGRSMDREKDLNSGETYQRIVGEPVYMNVGVPRSFDSVDVTMTYENPDQPLLKVGVVTVAEPQAVSLQPFENAVIDSALQSWTRIDGTGKNSDLTLLQRNKTVDSINAFLAAPPHDQKIGTYEYTLKADYIDPNYTPNGDGVTVNTLLRGSHTFLTYIKNETLHEEFTLRDINTEASADGVTVDVYHDDALINEQTLADDGITDASRDITGARMVVVDVPNLPEGVYRIELKTTNDIIIQHMHTSQRYFVAQQHVNIMNTDLYSTEFTGTDTGAAKIFFSGNKFIAHTEDLGGVQKMTINNDVVDVAAIRVPYSWARTTQVAEPYRTITLPSRDGILDGRGVYAFTQDSFFNPNGNIQALDESSRIDELDDILFRNYHSAEVDETLGLKTQTATISLNGVQGDRKNLTFVFSAPGLDRLDATVTVHRIEYTFHRKPFLTRLRERFFH